MPHDDDHWTKYNGTQAGRPVRPLLRDAMAIAGPGSGRTAIDLGCGAGIESRALLDAGYSLPYQSPESFHRVWALMLAALRPGGVLAVNLFGENDSWAGNEGETFLSADAVRALFDGFDVRFWAEEDEDGPAFGGPRHWHVFDVIAVASFSP